MSSDWRNTRDYRIWRVTVVRRDKVCMCCGTRQNRQAHHLNSGSYFPEQRFLPENGVLLCYNCHKSLHIDICLGYRKKCTVDDYVRFKKVTRLILREVR